MQDIKSIMWAFFCGLFLIICFLGILLFLLLQKHSQEDFNIDAYEIIPVLDRTRNDMFRFYDADNNDDLKKLLCSVGPLWASTYHMPSTYSRGEINTPNDATGRHAMLLIGYDVDDAAGPYWILKNSWGEYYGNFLMTMQGQYEFAFDSLFYGMNFKNRSYSGDKNTSILYDVNIKEQILEQFPNLAISTLLLDGQLEAEPKGFGVILPSQEERDRILQKIQESGEAQFFVQQPIPLKFQQKMSFETDNNTFGIPLTPISHLDQRQCGSCWCFAFCALFSSYLNLYSFLKFNKPIYINISAQVILELYESYGSDPCDGAYVEWIDKNMEAISFIPESVCPYICDQGYQPSSCHLGLCHYASSDRPIHYSRGPYTTYGACKRQNKYRVGCEEKNGLYYANCIPTYDISTIDYCTRNHYSRANKGYCLGTFAGGKWLRTHEIADRECRERQNVDRCDRVGTCYYPRCRDGYHVNQADGLECIQDDFPVYFQCDSFFDSTGF